MAKDIIHNAVKNALINDGWVITADPYRIKAGDIQVYADLAADRPIAAEKGTQKIVVEIKSFVGHSMINDLYEALGQYLIYLRLLETTASDRKLWLAVSDIVFHDFFQMEAIQDVVTKYGVDILVVNIESEEVEQWIS